MKNADLPAMPLNDGMIDVGSVNRAAMGLTKREDFTKAAMTALLSNPAMVDTMGTLECRKWVAREAIHMADVALAALESPGGES